MGSRATFNLGVILPQLCYLTELSSFSSCPQLEKHRVGKLLQILATVISKIIAELNEMAFVHSSFPLLPPL